MLKKIIFLVISALILTYIANEIYVKLYEWNDPQNCFKKEYVDTIGYAGECKGKLIVNNDILRKLVNGEYNGDKIKEYGFIFKVINNYDDDNIFTGQVTDMSALFLNKEVKYGIEDWNTSNVTNMRSMFKIREIKNPEALLTVNYFESASKFTKKDFELVVTSELKEDIENWDVSKVTDMYEMFYNRIFNKSLNKWNVSNVTNMSGMFDGAIVFNKPLNNWNVSNVTNMSGMFDGAIAFNKPLNNWNVSKVKYMSSMFEGAIEFNQPLNNWDVSNVKNMSHMFEGAIEFNQPLNNWNVSNVNNMWRIFNQAKSFNQPLNNWINKNLRKYDFENSAIEDKNLPELNKEKK